MNVTKNLAAVAGAAVLSAVAVTGCTDGATSVKHEAAPAPSASQSPEPVTQSPTPEPAPKTKTKPKPKPVHNDKNADFELGDAAVYYLANKKAATIKVSDLDVYDQTRVDYGEAPKHHYVRFLVTVHVLPGITEGYDSAYHVNPFNWHLTGTDGFDYDRAIMESGERDLPARDLH
ncbi:MAG: hypothetical protein ACRDQA_30355, partial [Nocardioidaceae bacterium]